MAQQAINKVETLISGEKGTTGREPFEDGTPTVPGGHSSSLGTGAAGAGVTGQEGHHHSHHHHHEHGHGVEGHDHHDHHHGVGDFSPGAATAGTPGWAQNDQPGHVSQLNQGDNHGHDHTHHHTHHHHHQPGEGHQVGPQGQDSHLYEGGPGGPVTGGAPGTDRFDSTSADTGTGGIGGTGHTTTAGTENRAYQEDETAERAEGKSTGGVAGVFGTSDKDFTGRDRLGKGAYEDDQGHYQSNTSGPSGQSALTGREGNVANNPVAQAKGSHQDSNVQGQDQQPHEKKGLMEKIKDVVS